MMMGVADMPIQTLKLLNIHPDAKANKKGKSKASGDDATSTADSARDGRPPAERSATGTSDNSSSSNLQGMLSKSGRNSDENTAANSPGTPGTPGTSTHRSTFMAQAFSESVQRSRSPSRDRCGRRTSSISTAETRDKNGAASPAPKINNPDIGEGVDSAIDTGKGLARIVGAGFRSPMDFSLGVAKGLHNVPKLYGADVRKVDKVTDLQSGLRTAAKARIPPELRNSMLTRCRGLALVFMMALLALSPILTKAPRRKAQLDLSKVSARASSVFPFASRQALGQSLAML